MNKYKCFRKSKNKKEDIRHLLNQSYIFILRNDEVGLLKHENVNDHD